MPVAFRHSEKKTAVEGNITIPTVTDSELPGLLGLTALRKNRAILDLNTMKVHFCGPGDYDLQAALPPGTDSIQAEIAPSGHMVVPCCEFDERNNTEEHTLTLLSRPPGLQANNTARSSNNTNIPTRNRSRTRPPTEPPTQPAPEMPRSVEPHPPQTPPQ